MYFLYYLVLEIISQKLIINIEMGISMLSEVCSGDGILINCYCLARKPMNQYYWPERGSTHVIIIIHLVNDSDDRDIIYPSV